MRAKKWEEPVLIRLGANIRTQRKELGLTQEALAFKTKMHLTYIGGIERGERNVSIMNLCRIAQALEILPSALLEGVFLKGDEAQL